MSCWRILVALLMLSQIVMAEEELTPEQVVQRWIKEQREHLVSQVKFSYIEIDQKFLHQTNRLGELTYTSETSGQYRIIPWSSTKTPPSVRRGYELREDESTFDVSWNESTLFVHEVEGTLQATFPRQFSAWWCQSTDLFQVFVQEAIPPLFPGPVSESRIAKYDWSITKREPDSIWLRGIPKAKKEKSRYIPTWDAIIATDSWQVRAVRRIYSEKETVMVIVRD
ncbi:MAG: hypothetical protein U0929_10650 [Planctomycetaceae bacterium]